MRDTRRAFLFTSAGASAAMIAGCVAADGDTAQVAQALSDATGTIRVYNVTQYASLQDAADAVPATGGILYFPERTHLVSAAVNLRPSHVGARMQAVARCCAVPVPLPRSSSRARSRR